MCSLKDYSFNVPPHRNKVVFLTTLVYVIAIGEIVFLPLVWYGGWLRISQQLQRCSQRCGKFTNSSLLQSITKQHTTVLSTIDSKSKSKFISTELNYWKFVFVFIHTGCTFDFFIKEQVSPPFKSMKSSDCQSLCTAFAHNEWDLDFQACPHQKNDHIVVCSSILLQSILMLIVRLQPLVAI